MVETQAPAGAQGGYRALLRNRAYRTVLGSEVLVHLGGSLYVTILPWLVLDITGSRRATGWATTAIYLPYLLVSVLAGMLVDRTDRRRLMIAAYLLRAFLVAAIPALYAAGVLAGWHVLLNAAVVSSFALVSYLARSSLIPQVVSKEEIVTANSANSVLIGSAMMIGTALVGPAVRHWASSTRSRCLLRLHYWLQGSRSPLTRPHRHHHEACLSPWLGEIWCRVWHTSGTIRSYVLFSRWTLYISSWEMAC